MKKATKRFVSVVTRNHSDMDGIVIALYRPSGGGIACSREVDIDHAIALRDDLDEAINLMTAMPIER